MDLGPVYLSECSGVYRHIPPKHTIVRNDLNTQRLLLEDLEGFHVVCTYQAYEHWLRGRKVGSLT